jgi:hypothetical protein
MAAAMRGINAAFVGPLLKFRIKINDKACCYKVTSKDARLSAYNSLKINVPHRGQDMEFSFHKINAPTCFNNTPIAYHVTSPSAKRTLSLPNTQDVSRAVSNLILTIHGHS